MSMLEFFKRSTPAGPEMEPVSPKEDESGDNLKTKISNKMKGGASKAKKKTKHLAGKVKAAFSPGSGSQSGDSSHDSGDEVDPRTEEESFSDSHTSAPATTPRSELNYHSMPSSPSSMASRNSGPGHQNLQDAEDAQLWQRTKEQFVNSPPKTSAEDETFLKAEDMTPGDYAVLATIPDKDDEMVVVLSSSVFDSKEEDAAADASMAASMKPGQEGVIEEKVVTPAAPVEEVQGVIEDEPVVVAAAPVEVTGEVTEEELVAVAIATPQVAQGVIEEEPVADVATPVQVAPAAMKEESVVVAAAPVEATPKELEEELAAPLTPISGGAGEIEEECAPSSAPLQSIPVEVSLPQELSLTSPARILDKAVKDTGFFEDQSGKSAVQWACDTTKAPFSAAASMLIGMADHPDLAGPVVATSSTLVLSAYDAAAATFNWFLSPLGTGLPRRQKPVRS